MASVYDPNATSGGIVDSANSMTKPLQDTSDALGKTPASSATSMTKPLQIPNEPAAGTSGGTFASGGAANSNPANPATGQPAGMGPLMPGDMSSNGSPAAAPAAGVVNSAAPVQPTVPAPTGPTTKSESITPQMGEVSKMATVQGQLGDILQTGNPLIEAAKARAAQAANARGLQNSSMAVQGGEEAMVNQALPIATADAAAYQKQQLVNQDIANQFLGIDKNKAVDLEKAYEAFKQNNFMFDKDSSLKQLLQRNDISSAEKIAAMQQATQISVAGIGAQSSNYATDMRLREAGMTIDAQREFQNAGFSQADRQRIAEFSQRNLEGFANGMNNIMNNGNLDPESRSNAVRTWGALYTGVPTGLNIDVANAFPTTAGTKVGEEQNGVVNNPYTGTYRQAGDSGGGGDSGGSGDTGDGGGVGGGDSGV